VRRTEPNRTNTPHTTRRHKESYVTHKNKGIGPGTIVMKNVAGLHAKSGMGPGTIVMKNVAGLHAKSGMGPGTIVMKNVAGLHAELQPA
jgi:hypothetical protein